jgi:alkylated DNA repair dioxygenase AlkB
VVSAHTSISTEAEFIPTWERRDLFPVVRSLFEYGPGEDRATGYLFGDGHDWPPALFVGPDLLDRLEARFRIRFTTVAFQAYRNGAGCDWHADTPFDAQAILSLGATRTFGLRLVGGEPSWVEVSSGSLVFMPPGFQRTHEHCVPVEDVAGERISLVFRTVAKG